MIVSQLFFALIHLPMLVNKGGNILLPLLWTVLGGIFLAVLYLRTENLLLVVGLHALMNKPTLLIHPSFPPQIVIAAFMILLLLCWQVWVPFIAGNRYRSARHP